MKFKADENLPVEVAQLLREVGYDAHSVRDEGLSGTKDPDLMAVCQREDRVLLTLDLGFADIRAYQPATCPGIIVLRPRDQSKPQVLGLVQRIVPLLSTEAVTGKLWLVDDQKVRIREG